MSYLALFVFFVVCWWKVVQWLKKLTPRAERRVTSRSGSCPLQELS